MELKKILKSLGDFFLPQLCPCCKKQLQPDYAVDGQICLDCWQGIKKNLPPFCYFCGRRLGKDSLAKNVCPACCRKNLNYDRAYAVAAYEGVMKELICEFKYKRKKRLANILARLMLEFIEEYKIPIWFIDYIIAIPLHPARLREREFNQSALLARIISEKLQKNLLINVLMRKRYNKSQAGLEDARRQENVKDVFLVKDNSLLKDKNILLIDDVITTGATSSEAARVLKEAGCRSVFVMALAN